CARHQYGQFQSASAFRRAAFPHRRFERQTQRRPPHSLREENSHHGKSSADHSRLVRHPAGKPGRQHQPPGETVGAGMIRRTGFLSFALVFFAGAVCFAAGPAGRSDVADAAMKRDRAALRALIQQKADVNAPQVDGATAMHWAVYNDDVESADLLIKAGAKADTENREGITPLHLASQYGNAAIIDRLIKAGADA